DANQARRQLLEKRQNVAPLDLAAKHHIALRIDGVNLENRLRNVETDGRNRLHDLAPPNRGALSAPTSMALPCRWRSRPQHRKRTLTGNPPMSAKCHVWTAPSWQRESSRRVAGRCTHVFGLLARFT